MRLKLVGIELADLQLRELSTSEEADCGGGCVAEPPKIGHRAY